MSTTPSGTPTAPSTLPRSPRFALVFCAVLVLTSLGCAFGEIRLDDPFDREETLEEAQHRYTTLVRFSEFQKARSFVVDDQKDEFRRRMGGLDEVRFTDFDSEEIELGDDKDQATVYVKYTVYSSALPYEVEVEETQEWTREGLSNEWKVRSTFEGLQKLASN